MITVKCDKCDNVIGYQTDDYQDWIAEDEDQTKEAIDFVKTAHGLFCLDCVPIVEMGKEND